MPYTFLTLLTYESQLLSFLIGFQGLLPPSISYFLKLPVSVYDWVSRIPIELRQLIIQQSIVRTLLLQGIQIYQLQELSQLTKGKDLYLSQAILSIGLLRKIGSMINVLGNYIGIEYNYIVNLDRRQILQIYAQESEQTRSLNTGNQ